MNFLTNSPNDNVAAAGGGGNNVVTNNGTSSTISSNMQLVLAALQNVPVEDKRDLVEALVTVPQLVEKESNPIRFLQFENGDRDAAAVRLCTYWKNRKHFFKERAFLPMNITGNGAMSTDDIFQLSRGFMRILPNDKDGRAVVYLDKENFISMPLNNRKRITFYILHVVAFENDVAVTKGYIYIAVCTNFKTDGNSAPVSGSVLKGLPLRTHFTQVFCDNENSTVYNVIASFAALLVRFFGIHSLQSTKLDIIASPQERLIKLRPLGLERSGLPTELGGILGPEAVFEWIRNRITADSITRESSFAHSTSSRGNSVSELNFQQHFDQLKQPPTPTAVVDPTTTTRMLLTGPTMPSSITPANTVGGRGTVRGLNLDKSSSSMQAVDLPQDLLLRLQQPANSYHVGPTVFSPSINQYQPDTTTLLANNNIPLLPTNTATLTASSIPAVASLPQSLSFTDRQNSSVVALASNNDLSSEPVTAAMILFEEAMKIIPLRKKLAYLEALEKAPFLFQKECNPLKFLYAEEFNSWKAAERMVNYWDLRKEFFGERAFLPMNQTGRGALTSDDVICLGGGYAAVGPKTNDGRSILIFDRTRQLNNPSGSNVAGMRSAFYIMTVLAEDEINIKKGIEVLSMMVTPRAVEYGEKNFQRALRLGTCFPIKTASLHIVSCPPKSAQKSVVERVLTRVMGLLKSYFPDRLKLYTAECPQEVICQLKKLGFTEDHLPASFGGVWKYDEFTYWLRQRKRYEEELTHLSDPWIFQPMARPANESLTNEERKAHKRRLNVVHSRQKRERRKAEVMELKQKCFDIRAEHKILKEENDRLENLLAESKMKIAKLEQKRSI